MTTTTGDMNCPNRSVGFSADAARTEEAVLCRFSQQRPLRTGASERVSYPGMWFIGGVRWRSEQGTDPGYCPDRAARGPTTAPRRCESPWLAARKGRASPTSGTLDGVGGPRDSDGYSRDPVTRASHYDLDILSRRTSSRAGTGRSSGRPVETVDDVARLA